MALQQNLDLFLMTQDKEHKVGEYIPMPKQDAKDEPDHSDELTIAYMSGLHRGKEVAQRTWVGLTDEEINAAASCQSWKPFAKAIEAKLKDKNT
jgi:hypothetical protein